MAMEIATTRFGPLWIEDDDVIRFPTGLVGLEDCRRWVLLADDANEAIAWLQSVDCPEIALAVVSPRRFVPDYQMRVARRELEPLALEAVETAEVLTILGKAEGRMTLNLKAPVVVNPERRLGRQVVVNGETPVRHALGSAPVGMKRIA